MSQEPTLPPFDGDSECRKCRATDARTIYHDGSFDYAHSASGACPAKYGPDTDHLCRICTRCGFRWAERCEDR